MRQLVLTEDHEIFGNGCGDVRRHIIDPTESMARTCEIFGMPLTVFFEAEEFLAFERERDKLIQAWGYDPAAEVRAQAISLIQRGHDIQLHLHPEWMGSVFEAGRWELRQHKRTVDSLFDTGEEAVAYIRERKAVIDGFHDAAGSERRVRAYRCGGFCGQPGEKLLRALAENGIIVDSSVVKGMVRKDEHVLLDYTGAPADRRHWRVFREVTVENTAGLVTEIPIFSRMGRRVYQLTPRRLLAKFSRRVPKDTQLMLVSQLGIGPTPFDVLHFLAQRVPIKLDFHNMSSKQMLRWIKSAPPAPEGDLDVIVLIGHSKEHRNNGELQRFLASVAEDTELEVVSMSEVAERLGGLSGVSESDSL